MTIQLLKAVDKGCTHPYNNNDWKELQKDSQKSTDLIMIDWFTSSGRKRTKIRISDAKDNL